MTAGARTRPSLPGGEPPRPGLRARKKARTQSEIQRAAFGLFRRRGYGATTMMQVAEAAEVSPSTLFRYFPTKESLVLWDGFDPLILQAFMAQPATSSPVQAFRAALHTVLDDLPPRRRREIVERVQLMLNLPPVRVALLDHAKGPMQQTAELVATRMGRPVDDLAVRSLVGAIAGTVLAALLYAGDHPGENPIDQVDAALGDLDSGNWGASSR